MKSQTTRVAVGVEYDGSRLAGWQRQASPELPTVQGLLQAALGQVADETVSLTVAGRTDAGVHATAQVAHFDCSVDRGAKAWIRGANSLLPPEVRVTWAAAVPESFHARFSAEARRYMYVIQQREVAPAILSGRVTWSRQTLDAAAMHQAARPLLGEHDFSSFRAAGCQSNTPRRKVHEVTVFERQGFTVIDIQANAFLLHMVRNIAGALMAVGRGERFSEWVGELLQAEDRTLGEPTAPPDGLYLVQVKYPPDCGLPPECLTDEAAPPPFIARRS